jgi:prevent-host-death family protein
MTINSYNELMKQVRIADLKAHLSEHLRTVRRGQRLTVLDRDTPVAEIVPYERGRAETLTVSRHKARGTPTGRVPLPPLPRTGRKLKRDIVEVLLEERGDR